MLDNLVTSLCQALPAKLRKESGRFGCRLTSVHVSLVTLFVRSSSVTLGQCPKTGGGIIAKAEPSCTHPPLETL